MEQQRVSLRYRDQLVTFDWPLGAELVTITNSLGVPLDYSIEEAHEIFWQLLDGGAY